MKKIDVIFIVLTYRNTDDLVDFFKSARNGALNYTYRVVVVDAFYSNEVREKIKSIALENDADFIPIENKGYSFGNNAGIEYANSQYDYDYLVVSNADIEVETFDRKRLDALPDGCYGPQIINKSGKNQNPMYCKANILSRKMVCKGFRLDNKLLLVGGLLLNKIQKFFQMKQLKHPNKVYQLHGSFLIFSKQVIEEITPVFDDNMFLFAEETYLAYRLAASGIESFYVPELKVLHKEDGSMQFNPQLDSNLKEANLNGEWCVVVDKSPNYY